MRILALLQDGTMCLVSLVKIQNDPIRTEGGVVFQSSQKTFGIPGLAGEIVKFWLCHSLAQYSFSGKTFRMIQ